MIPFENWSATTWIIQAILGILALFYANFIEWAFHRYVLHGLGKRRGSLWSFHWAEHHRNARRHDFLDPDYRSSLLKWNAQSKELVALLIGGIVHLPLLFLAPLAYGALLYAGMNYYYVHRKSHLDPEWAKANLPWHYAHHMERNQDANWCVTRPWFDRLLGTSFSSRK